MFYPSQRPHCQEYVHHGSSQQTYSRSPYYYNGDESSSTYVTSMRDDVESFAHCPRPYVSTPNCYVTTSLGLHADEMPSRQATPHTRSLSCKSKNVTPTRAPPTTIDTSPSACWDWLLFSPTSHPELYTCVYQPQSSRPDDDNDDDDSHLCASLPTCLLALLYLTRNLSDASDDENESDQEISTLHPIDEPLSNTSNISSTSSLSSTQAPTDSNRSSTPDTDDGYQSASDASRSDYSQSSSGGGGHRAAGTDPAHEPSPSVVPRISYAAAVKPLVAPLTTSINKPSSSITTASKGKQTMHNSLSTVNGASDNYTNNNSQKIKFIAPRFERIHHAKQQHPAGSSATRSTHAGRRR